MKLIKKIKYADLIIKLLSDDQFRSSLNHIVIKKDFKIIEELSKKENVSIVDNMDQAKSVLIVRNTQRIIVYDASLDTYDDGCDLSDKDISILTEVKSYQELFDLLH